MHQFFVDWEQVQAALQAPGKVIGITGQDVKHIKNVLRMKEGDEVSLSDGITDREYRCVIEKITDQEIACKLIFIKEADAELSASVYLFQGLPKGDKMEWIIQKAVELGVCEIIPVATRRSVMKLDQKKGEQKCSRWRGIAEAAAKQSRRKQIPLIKGVMSFSEAAAYAEAMDIKLIPYEMAEGMERTRQLIESLIPGQKIAVFIGPEGGFDEKEISIAGHFGIVPITMGKRILRTETAGMVILSWIMYHLECEAY